MTRQFNIATKEKKLVDEYHKKLFEIYDREKLLCLSDEEITFDGKNSNQFVSDNVSRVRTKVNGKNELDKITHELIYSTSGNIKFALGNIYLFKEYGINDFIITLN